MPRAGYVAIVGLPNVGKSTLMNRILGQKVTIVAPRPQTTRNRVLGVKNFPDAQLVLLDTPGLHRPGGRRRSELNRFMVEEALTAIESVDVVLVMVEHRAVRARFGESRAAAPRDATAPVIIDDAHKFLVEALAKTKKPAILALNKVDLLRDKRELLPVLDAWSRAYGFRALIPISAAAGTGVDELTDQLVALLPEGERLFPEEMITDRAERWLASEMIREQVFLLTRQEVPYAVAVTIDTFTERLDAAHDDNRLSVVIEATIHVEKDAQKRILVGEGGQMVREIGSRARREIATLLDCRVHLQLFVRVDEGWTSSQSGLRRMGYE